MRVYLFNDTSTENHAGCQAVMESLGKALSGHEIIARNCVGERFYDHQAMRTCDAVVVNGEGTLHHGRGAWLLEMLELGQSLGKRTLLVNALFQFDPPFFPDVLRRLDYFSVREIRSLKDAWLCGGDPELLLDSCVGASLEGGQAMPAVAGIVKGGTHQQSPAHGLLEALSYQRYGLQNSFKDFVATLRNCRLYITGEHHGVYACGLAGVPFVALPSNSHKIEGLLEWSGLPIPVATTLGEVYQQVEWALGHPEVFVEFQKFLLTHRCFQSADLDRALAAARPAPTLIRNYDETGARRLVGATQFFRNRPLLRTVLDQVDATRERVVALSHSCSVGCEAYSLAIAWKRYFQDSSQDRPAPELKIYATDRSERFLDQARRAVYPASELDGMLPEEQAFFTDAGRGEIRLAEEIRSMVTFLPAASFTDFQSPESCDLVFLLNSLLYVSAADQARTIDRIAEYNPGLLMITGGHSESLKQDLTRNGYSADSRNLGEIYYAWGDRFALDPGQPAALGPIGTEEDADFRYCSVFRKQAAKHSFSEASGATGSA